MRSPFIGPPIAMVMIYLLSVRGGLASFGLPRLLLFGSGENL